MVTFEIKEDNSKSTLIVNGELSIAGAAEFKEVLMKLYESSKNLFLDLENVSSIDTSCLQLLCAAHKSSMDSDINIEIKDELSEHLKQSVTNAGYIRNVNCNTDSSKSCFWVSPKEGQH